MEEEKKSEMTEYTPEIRNIIENIGAHLDEYAVPKSDLPISLMNDM